MMLTPPPRDASNVLSKRLPTTIAVVRTDSLDARAISRTPFSLQRVTGRARASD